MTAPRTLFDKIWQAHQVVAGEAGLPDVLAIDLHLLHEVTSPQAFAELDRRGLAVHRPRQCLATMDHSTPTAPELTWPGLRVADPQAADQLDRLAHHCERHGIPLLGWGHPERGIVHVVGPELGVTHPGMTIVCGDSHTSTHGAFGALAFGIGTSEVAAVLATQCLLQRRPKTLAVQIAGTLPTGTTAKDLILALIAHFGVDFGTGYCLEYRGEAVGGLALEERMTICNMSIEAGARAGLIAPDDTTYHYLEGRPGVPRGAAWERALERWQGLPSDPEASFDARVTFDASTLEPRVTYGTNPGMSVAISERLPTPDALPVERRPGFEKALAYMGLEPGQALAGHPIDVVFVGSCTNGRLSDLRAAARVLDGHRVHPRTRMLVVPGSERVRRAAEAEGLDQVFRAAGAEWRAAGCSMCLAMNGDRLAPGQAAVATSNRNFEGRQGPGGRTFLASPATAAASAIAGAITAAREI